MQADECLVNMTQAKKAEEECAQKLSSLRSDLKRALQCVMCGVRPAAFVIDCGHAICNDAERMSSRADCCSLCRRPIGSRTTLFFLGGMQDDGEEGAQPQAHTRDASLLELLQRVGTLKEQLSQAAAAGREEQRADLKCCQELGQGLSLLFLVTFGIHHVLLRAAPALHSA